MVAFSRLARTLLTAVAISLLTAASAQTGKAFPALEALLSPAERVFTGTIVDVTKKVALDPAGNSEYTLTVQVDESLKGTLGSKVVLQVEGQRYDDRWKQWSEAGTSFLWIVGPGAPEDWSKVASYTYPSGSAKVSVRWLALRLGTAAPAESWLAGTLAAPIFSMDLTVLRTPEEIIAAAKSFLRAFPHGAPLCRIDLPGSLVMQRGMQSAIYNNAYFPLIPRVEELARAMIQAPQAMVDDETRTREMRLDAPFSTYRKAGIDLLANFKSPQSIAILKPLLRDEAIWGYTRPGPQGKESGYEYVLRRRAYEVLTAWGIKVTRPTFEAPKSREATKSANRV